MGAQQKSTYAQHTQTHKLGGKQTLRQRDSDRGVGGWIVVESSCTCCVDTTQSTLPTDTDGAMRHFRGIVDGGPLIELHRSLSRRTAHDCMYLRKQPRLTGGMLLFRVVLVTVCLFIYPYPGTGADEIESKILKHGLRLFSFSKLCVQLRQTVPFFGQSRQTA